MTMGFNGTAIISLFINRENIQLYILANFQNETHEQQQQQKADQTHTRRMARPSNRNQSAFILFLMFVFIIHLSSCSVLNISRWYYNSCEFCSVFYSSLANGFVDHFILIVFFFVVACFQNFNMQRKKKINRLRKKRSKIIKQCVQFDGSFTNRMIWIKCNQNHLYGAISSISIGI